MYQPIYKPNQIICGRGQTVVVTGWTVKESVAKHLDASEYAGIGACYSSTRGLSPLIRNLLANPQVRYLVILNATREDRNAGACECLLDFWRHGFREGVTDTGRETWVINSPVTGYLDKEISQSALTSLRESIQSFEVDSIQEAIKLVRELSLKPLSLPWGQPMIFPVVEVSPTVLPGPVYGHRVEGKTIAETWVKILHTIKTTGKIRPTGYDGSWQELIDLTAIVTEEPDDFYFPEPNFLPIDRDFIKQYIPQILDDAPSQPGVKYTYGTRLRSWFGVDQIEQVVHKLTQEIDAASAVMSLWDVKDHDKGGSPCLNHIWLRVLDSELSITAIFRSNDMFAAWPANAMGLRALQQHICEQIQQRSPHKLRLGPLITISQSAHIYEDTWENVDLLIKKQYQKYIDKRDFYDSIGNFVIEIEDGKIVVKQTTPGSGTVVKTYSGTNPLQLLREITSNSPAINPEHAGYLGIELQKAAFSLKELDYDRKYRQDSKNP